MRISGFIVFLLIALGLYGLSHYYLLRRLSRALPPAGWVRGIVFGLVVAGALSFLVGRFFFGRLAGPAAEALIVAGYVYLALWLVTLWLTLAYDALRILDQGMRFFPSGARADAAAGGGLAFRFIAGAAVVLCFLGAWNAARTRLRSETVEIAKSAGDLPSMTIVVVSDLHLSPVLRSRFLDRILAKVKALDPDLVLLPGDIVGEDTPSRDRDRIAAAFTDLRPRFGVFACTGNHEYFGDLEKNLETLRRGGVRVLQDEAVVIAGAISLVGRRDRTVKRMGGARDSLKALAAGLNAAAPLIVMDHQPVGLNEAVEAGVDLLICGHTHNGQMIPITQINKFVYEINWGLRRKGATAIDVTSGAGTWGPPVRIGTIPEIVQITLRFKPAR
jgi:predicted MPP superfamily phosphohydrolase